MKTQRWISCLILLVAVCGCVRMKISTVHDPKATFTPWKSYAWMPEPAKEPEGIRSNPLLDGYFRETVEQQLAGQGYLKKTVDTADFLIGYHASLTKGMSVQIMNSYYNYPGSQNWDYPRFAPTSADTQVYEFSTGSLIIDLVDAKTRELEWRGSAEAHLDLRPSLKEKKARIKEAVQKILEQFPPKSK
jgi:Domain of unknown function (DUF4136)